MPCQRSKVHRHPVPPHKVFLPPASDSSPYRSPWSFATFGRAAIRTCIDRYTQWLKAMPLPDITVPTVAAGFVLTSVFQFGCPTELVTGPGHKFEPTLLAELLRLLETLRLGTSAYHLQFNSLVKCMHHHLKASHTNHMQWVHPLPLTLIGLPTAIKTDLGCSTAKLV